MQADFEAAYGAYARRLCAMARRMGLSPDEAQDTVHDVFLLTWLRRDALTHRGSLRGYLYTVVRCFAAQVRQKGAVLGEHRERVLQAELRKRDMASVETEADLRLRVRKVMAILTDEERDACMRVCVLEEEMRERDRNIFARRIRVGRQRVLRELAA
jgi:DNA-directed RNA polymerase specialized sigma24 family protein